MLEEQQRQLNTVLTEVIYLQQKIKAKQELAKISMDAYRNSILRASLNIAVASLGLAFPTVAAGFFGMNVVNGFELICHDTQLQAFHYIVGPSALSGAVVAGGIAA